MSDDLVKRLESGIATKAQIMGGFTVDIPATQTLLADAAAEITRLRAQVERLSQAEIAAIEASGKRWHGQDHRVVSVRWEPYKPDGQRQMKVKGRWQEQVGSGDYWRWQNCERPVALALTPKGDTP